MVLVRTGNGCLNHGQCRRCAFHKELGYVSCQKPPNVQISQDEPCVVTDDERDSDVFKRLKRGYNFTSVVTIARQEAYVKRNHCFYVVIAKEGVSSSHAFFRLTSKGSSVAVSAFGTQLFASISLMSVSASLMLLCLLLMGGFMARFAAMWIVSEMNQYEEPIIHTVVPDRPTAASYAEEILKLPGLIIEVRTHCGKWKDSETKEPLVISLLVLWFGC